MSNRWKRTVLQTAKRKNKKKHQQINVVCVQGGGSFIPSLFWTAIQRPWSIAVPGESSQASAAQGVPEPWLLPGSSKGCSQQDGWTQEGKSLLLVWQLSSPSEEHMGIIFLATSTCKGDMGYSLLQIAHCYHSLKAQRFWIWFLPTAVYPLRCPNLKPWQSGNTSRELRDGRLGSWWAIMGGHPDSKLGQLAEESCCSLPVPRALPPSLKSSLPRRVTMLELSPEDELTAASQHDVAGKTGMERARVQGKTWKNIWSGWKQTSVNTFLLSEHLTKRNAAEVGLLLIMNKIPQPFFIKDLPLIAVPCTCPFYTAVLLFFWRQAEECPVLHCWGSASGSGLVQDLQGLLSCRELIKVSILFSSQVVSDGSLLGSLFH